LKNSIDTDSYQNLFQQKPSIPQPNPDFHAQKRDFQPNFNKKNEANKQKNKQNRPPNDYLQKDPRFSDPFFQVTVQDNYDPLKKIQKPNANNVNNVSIENLPQSDIFFQRNPPSY
jgi:hypothetical protein